MNAAGLALEANPGDAEQLRHVRRAVYTLKGDSAACGFRELSELAHCLEDALAPDLAKNNAAEIAALVLTAVDTFKEMLTAYRASAEPPVGQNLRELVNRLLSKPVNRCPDASARPAVPVKSAWTEYERLTIAEACGRGEPVYHISLVLCPQTALTPLSLQLVRKAIEGVGRILAISPADADSSAHGH